MKIAATISAAIHGLMISYMAGFQLQDEILEDIKQNSGPEVISLEEYCEISTNSCFTPESSKVINPLISLEQEIDSKFALDNIDSENPKLGNLPQFVEEKMELDKAPQVGELEDFNEEKKNITDLKSVGNEEKLDIVVISNERPPPRNSQKIANVASNLSELQSNLLEPSLTSVIQKDAVILAKEKEGNANEKSSVEISLEGQDVEAILNAAPKIAKLPPKRPSNIEILDTENVSPVNYEGLISAALDDVLEEGSSSSLRKDSQASDNYILHKVEQSVASFYNTAALLGLADPEQYKVRVKFFVSSKGVNRNSIKLLEPKNPTDRHLLNLKYAKNAIIKALSDKANYISSENYPSGINIILNFTPTLGVGYD